MKLINKFFYCLVIIFIAGSTSVISAQTTEGTMQLEITGVTSDNPQIASMADMFKGNQTTVYFKGKQSLTKLSMMGGAVKVDIKVHENEDTDMLMDAMGNKIWVAATKAENDLMKAQMDNPLEEMEITYDQNDVKTVAGYQCYKMVVSFPDSESASIEAYITQDLDISAPVIQGVEMMGFEGFPLEYSFNNGMMTMTVTTSSFTPSVDDSVFELNTSGFKKMTTKEFADMMSSMGGGFGL